MGAVPALALDAWGSASGRSGCNRFMGRYLAGTRPSLSFGPLATTRMACPPASMNLESRFLGALAATQGYRVSEAVLRLEDETGKLLLELVPAPD